MKNKPNIAFVFWITGKRISDVEKQSYKDDMLMLFQKKSWADIRVCIEWENTHMLYISVK